MTTTNTPLPIKTFIDPTKQTACAVYGVYGTFSDGAPKLYGLGRFAGVSDALAFAETIEATWVRPNGKKHTFSEVHIYPMTYI